MTVGTISHERTVGFQRAVTSTWALGRKYDMPFFGESPAVGARRVEFTEAQPETPDHHWGTRVDRGLLEMSGTDRARHIPDVLMVYNTLTPHGGGKVNRNLMRETRAYVRQVLAEYAALRAAFAQAAQQEPR